jgi:hypothetical protein
MVTDANFGRTTARRRAVVVADLAVFALVLMVALGSTHRLARGGVFEERAHVTRTSAVAKDSPCAHPQLGRLVYHWPIKPFGRQHPVRGNFADPRTLAREAAFGADSPRSPGSFTFHNGIDIYARTGTAVYPVVSGTVERRLYADEVSVETNDGRIFQYFHIRPRVQVGAHVVAYRTLLGRVLPEWLHIHLSEIDVFRVHNPLDPGHLEPYADHTTPSVDALSFSAADGHAVSPQRLTGDVIVAANAEDLPPIPVPGEWFDLPVTPALISWRMTTTGGRIVVPETIVADFRHTEPRNSDFWRVYAPGTYQNFPRFGHRSYFHLPGRYLFNLTPTPIDTGRFPNGNYVVTAVVADVCGNRGSLSESIQIDNPNGPG